MANCTWLKSCLSRTLITGVLPRRNACRFAFGQASLRRAVAEYIEHYHVERNHQGIANRLICAPSAVVANNGHIRGNARLGGMLNFYYREAT
jgi:hypothetical protein